MKRTQTRVRINKHEDFRYRKNVPNFQWYFGGFKYDYNNTNSSKSFEAFDKSIGWLSNLQINLKNVWDGTNILYKISNLGLLTHDVHNTTSDDNFWHTVNSNMMKPNNKPHCELDETKQQTNSNMMKPNNKPKMHPQFHMVTLWQENIYSERHNVLYERQNYKIENHKNVRGWNSKWFCTPSQEIIGCTLR